MNCPDCHMANPPRGHRWLAHPPISYTPSPREIQEKAAQGLVRDYVKNEWVPDLSGKEEK